MPRDEARVQLVKVALEKYGYEALVCASPEDVLLVSGYWPVIGDALAIMMSQGACAVVAPEDEMDFVRRGWADRVYGFEAGSLKEIRTPEQVIAGPLASALADLGASRDSRVAVNDGPTMSPSGYAARFSYGPVLHRMLASHVRVEDGSEMLRRLRSVLTPVELENVRTACAIAEAAFLDTAGCVAPGMTEDEIASRLRSLLLRSGPDVRADGFAYCMSGPNSARAWAAYQHSTNRTVKPGDLVLLHCNSFHNGFWTDITRTLCAGRPDDRVRQMYDAVFEARDAALAAVRPGAAPSAVDAAARRVLTARGFGEAFRHPTGHGVGFAAANHDALPRIHPCAAADPLETGMVFNIEPGIYLEGLGGMRHCDMVLVTNSGCEVLTPFEVPTR